MIQVGMYIVVPLIIALVLGIVKWKKSNQKEPNHKESHHKKTNHKESHQRRPTPWGSIFIRSALAFIVAVIVIYPIGCVYWWSAYEVPSVQEKVITVQGWEPKPGINVYDNGMMIISNADQLLLVTNESEGFFNNENFLFQKFNTRDIFNQLKVGGTYKIKYYGWRNGFNSGFPNILSVEQVINETNATNNDYNKYFGTKFAN
ncbi:DUF1523 family protein [Methanobacterium sp. ACI-7]|uniref:DUF1523 family protein n=1 Tax=unclassified Methanobacterium TaxID=2627676 RepID=UPI0039C4696F